MNRELKCFRYCHLLNVIDSESHFDKIKYPGTIRDLFHTFWILCEDKSREEQKTVERESTRVGTLIVATIYLQLIQNRYMFRSFTVLHCSHQHCVEPIASDVEVVGYL